MLDQNPFNRFKDSIFFEERNDRVRFLEEDEIRKLLERFSSIFGQYHQRRNFHRLTERRPSQDEME